MSGLMEVPKFDLTWGCQVGPHTEDERSPLPEAWRRGIPHASPAGAPRSQGVADVLWCGLPSQKHHQARTTGMATLTW